MMNTDEPIYLVFKIIPDYTGRTSDRRFDSAWSTKHKAVKRAKFLHAAGLGEGSYTDISEVFVDEPK